MSLSLNIDDAGVSRLAARIRALGNSLGNRRELMEAIAFEGENQTRRRITVEKAAPDGTPWPDWSPAYAATRGAGKALLEGSGDLVDSVVSDAGEDFAEWGSNLVYFAIHNFGGTEDMAPGPAGIPQRQMLGLSDDNESDIQGIVDDWIERQIEEEL
tara:strand:- start:27494 stop:27964 length:471 start_codon:yes stop_codon:yes gene_type:complete